MSGALVLAELILVFGSLIGFGFWQLRSLRRDEDRAEDDKAESDEQR